MTAQPILMSLMTDDDVAKFGTDSDAGFGALRTERGCLPLAAMDVDARVAGVIASIELAQTFVNTTGAAIEATYIFPLPDRMAVHRFRMTIGARTIEGVVDERGAAREQYDQAIAAGHRAAISEEERPGVFTLRVGNLLAGEAATVRLSLVGPLPVDDGEVTFRFPLVVAPRYIPGHGLAGDQAGLGTAADTDLVPDASRISPPVMLRGCANPVRLGIRVALEDLAIANLASSLHAVTETVRDARVISVQPGDKLDRDFILRWTIAAAELQSSLVVAPDAEGGGTFMLTLVPPATSTVGARPRDVVFVIDRSGSMGGWKMVAARRATARMIDSLTGKDRFCTIAFDNVAELMPAAGLVAATDRERFRAVEALGKVDARGGTELAEPLRRAVGMLAGGTDERERVVVLITDGQVGNEDQILHELVPSIKNVRMFALGIDQAVNAAFLRRLASAGGGLCELVESEDRLDAVMAKVHRRIGTPMATELVPTATGIAIDLATLSPGRLPDVYAGAPVTILGRYAGTVAPDASIAIAGTSFGEPLAIRVVRDRATAGTWLPASWARARIRDLEDAYAVAGSPELAAQIVALSKRHAVLSRFTAYLAVDRSEVANPGGTLRQVVQPVESPAGWAQAAPQPAPPSMIMHQSVGAGATRGGAMKTMMAAPSSAPMGAPPKAPAPASPAPMQVQMSRSASAGMADKSKRDSSDAKELAAPSTTAYHGKLAALAKELASKATGDAAALRLVRQRLVEWVEDVRSVGGLDALAAEVERLIARLAAALVAGDPAEIGAVATALTALAGGGAEPAKKSRLAFWK